MPGIGGDSQNTTPVAIQAGLQANKLAKPMLDAAKQEGFQKLPFDQFVSTVKGQTAANVPLADAMQQQSMFVRWAQKMPFVGKRIQSFLGPDAALNNVIGTLGKKELAGVNPAEITRIAYQGGDVAKNLVAAGVPEDTAKQIATAAAERAAAAGGQTAAQEVVSNAVKSGLSEEGIAGTLAKYANGGMLAGKSVSTEAIQQAISEGGDIAGNLSKLGVRSAAAKAIAKQAATSATESAATEGAQQATKTVAKDAVEQTAKSGGIKGFFGKLLGGAKGNFIISGIFSIGSNAIQLATGKMNLKQFIGLSLMDTGAYGLIGLGSAAAGGAIAGAVGQALIPIPGLGFLVGLGLGMLGGLIYEKFLRNPVKNMLGPSGGGAPAAYDPNAQQGVQPGQYQDPYAQNAPQQAPAQQPYQDPYAQQQAPAAAPTTGMPAPGDGTTYEQAAQYLNQLGAPQQ